MNSLKGNAQLLQKLPVPKAVFPLATVISGVINLASRWCRSSACCW
jgi:ABC-type polysaccharide/polyol phosphate export permease